MSHPLRRRVAPTHTRHAGCAATGSFSPGLLHGVHARTASLVESTVPGHVVPVVLEQEALVDRVVMLRHLDRLGPRLQRQRTRQGQSQNRGAEMRSRCQGACAWGGVDSRPIGGTNVGSVVTRDCLTHLGGMSGVSRHVTLAALGAGVLLLASKVDSRGHGRTKVRRPNRALRFLLHASLPT